MEAVLPKKQIIVDGKKACTVCLEMKPLKKFGPYPRNGRFQLRPQCNECRGKAVKERRAANPEWAKEQDRKASAAPSRARIKRRSRLKHSYSISIEGYKAIFDGQNGKCAICGIDHSEVFRSLNVDHCHATGKIRGLLCGNCNNGLGRFKDSAKFLQSALAYLQAHGG